MIVDNSHAELQELLMQANNPVTVNEVASQLRQEERLRIIMEHAYNHAVARGIESKMNEVRQAVALNERQFDAIYNFQPLMIQSKIVPPVITESRDIIQNPDDLTIKTTGAVYKIDQQARFATLPPNWRTYLTFPEDRYKVGTNETITGDLAPKNRLEREKVRKEIIRGFKDGQAQGVDIFQYAFNKLNRDYTGMIKFHEFVMAGKLTMPAFASQTLAVASTGNSLSLDQSLLTITQLPSFNSNIDTWKSWITPVKAKPGEVQIRVNKAED